MSVIAQWDSTCPDCDRPIPEGSEIVHTTSGWVHRQCPPDDLDKRPGEVTCTRCWLIHPAGDCD